VWLTISKKRGMEYLLTWKVAAVVIALVSMFGVWRWFRMPRIIFGQPENIGGQKFFIWWHLPIEIRALFFQRKSIEDSSISVYVHGGGVGTIVREVKLCWRSADGPRRTLTIERRKKHVVPVSLRSTHWTRYTVDLNHGLSLTVPPRIALLCDQSMMLAGRIPMNGLANEYYFSFRVSRSNKTLGTSGLYKLVVPFPSSNNSEFTFEKQS
jgi:hypothetical protein